MCVKEIVIVICVTLWCVIVTVCGENSGSWSGVLVTVCVPRMGV